MSQNNIFTLPAGPSELCFDKNEFMKATFSVDDFLHEHRNAASLEVMRDDLGTYLKILRLAMIELINHDYGDFVNLSNKLVGLHEYINNIRTSLENLQGNITEIKVLLENVMNDIENCLDSKKELIAQKKTVRSLVKVQMSISKLIELLNDNVDINNGQVVKPSTLERASLELMQSQFHAKFCNKYLDEGQKFKVEELEKRFLDKMRLYFLNVLEAMKTSSSTSSVKTSDLEQCLRIYVSLDKCDVAEQVFQEIVSKYMETRITENALQTSRNGVADIYTEILNFISLHMKDILLITYYTEKIKGFNFLINSYWKEVEQRLETNLATIFAPGNPDNFYVNYKCTQDFLRKFETIFGTESAITEFRNHSLTKQFQMRWNLPVYFQIRFQEIASPLESYCLTNSSLASLLSASTSIFQLAQSKINQCWSDGVYIEQLYPKFLKLTLQIISRVCKYIGTLLQQHCQQQQQQEQKQQQSGKSNEDHSIVQVYLEIHEFFQNIHKIRELVRSKMPQEIYQKQKDYKILVDKCFDSVEQQIIDLLKQIERVLIMKICIECEKCIRQVGDIPRLYRKTNREIPNKPSAYIKNIVNMINDFIKRFNVLKNEGKIHEILMQIYSTTTEKYYISVQDVLTSVQKTEESLKRLKSLRDKTVNLKNSPETSTSSTTVSDDDKIRFQLQLDVMHWYKEIIGKEFTKESINKLTEITNLIEDMIKK